MTHNSQDNDETADKNELAMPKGELLVYQTEDGRVKLDVRLEDETVWLTQQMIAELFQTTKQNYLNRANDAKKRVAGFCRVHLPLTVVYLSIKV